MGGRASPAARLKLSSLTLISSFFFSPFFFPVLRDREDDYSGPEERSRLGAGGISINSLPGFGTLHHAPHYLYSLLSVDGWLTALPEAGGQPLYIGCILLYL